MIADIERRRVVKSGATPLFWLDYEQCCAILEQGIEAEKLNFSNTESRQVTIRLTHKRTHITYISEDKKIDCMSKLSGSNERSVAINTFVNLVYGG